MKCNWCGTNLPPNSKRCYNCGKPLPPTNYYNSRYQESLYPQIKQPEEDLYTEILTEEDLKNKRLTNDPEQELKTQYIKGEPKPIEIGYKIPRGGIPDSQLARDIDKIQERFFLWLRRIGRFGRLMFYSNIAICILSFFPWFKKPGFGYVEGILNYGWIITIFSATSILCLHLQSTLSSKKKSLPVLINIFITSMSLELFFWIWKFPTPKDETVNISYQLVFGFYIALFCGIVNWILSFFQIKYIFK